jgi:hypothetical protein
MAFLAYYGRMSPSEFAESDPAETDALERAIAGILESERTLQLELTKAIVKSNGGRVL